MDHADLFKYSEQFPEQFAGAATFAEFAASLDGDKPGPGRFLQHIAARYPGGSDLSFRTIKAHGYVGKELLLPEARKASDLFADVSLYPYQSGGLYRHQIEYVIAGAAFISALRAPGFAYFGHLGATYDRSPVTGGKRISRGQHWLTAAKPSQAVIDAYGACGEGEWDLATFEVIQRDGGELLVIGRSHNGFGVRWLALLDPGESVIPMLGEHERGEIAAELDRQNIGWAD